MIPYSHQAINADDVAAVLDALESEWLTQGPRVDEFEEALAASVGARYAVAYSSGTAALHGAAAAAGLGAGDVVVTSPLSFAASANCIRYVGATPEFVDVDPRTLNLDLGRVSSHVAGVVAVHYAGLPADLALLPHRPRVVIEDAAHALGAVTPDGPVGNCAHSDMCVFSFHPVKTITSGEGGAVMTNDAILANRMRAFRNHGIVRQPEHGGWYYEIEHLGYNYRITDLQAALGTSQLRRLEPFVSRRNELADRYRRLLEGLPVKLPPVAPAGWRHGYHLFPVRVAARREVYDRMRAAGIGVQVHFVPTYRHPAYADLGLSPASFPATEEAYQQLLSLPLFPGLEDRQQDLVVETLRASL